MLIEFKIQLDGSGGAKVVQPQPNPNPNPNLPSQKQLAPAYPLSTTGGEPPESPDDIGTGLPQGTPPSSGSGMIFVIGPIVICGSGPAQAVPGGAPLPGNGIGTGKPAARENNKTQAAKVENPPKRGKA